MRPSFMYGVRCFTTMLATSFTWWALTADEDWVTPFLEFPQSFSALGDEWVSARSFPLVGYMSLETHLWLGKVVSDSRVLFSWPWGFAASCERTLFIGVIKHLTSVLLSVNLFAAVICTERRLLCAVWHPASNKCNLGFLRWGFSVSSS